MGVRLTNDLREVLVARIIAHGFDARAVALLDEEHALARRLYDHRYPAKHQKVMESLPKGFMPEDEHMRVYVGGEHHQFELGACLRQAATPPDRFALAADDKIGALCLDVARRKDALESERRKATSEARHVLRNVSSLAKLLEVWPAVASFTKGIGGDKPVTTLARPIATLNSTLGLPPVTVKAP